jgi:hypothetical protein
MQRLSDFKDPLDMNGNRARGLKFFYFHLLIEKVNLSYLSTQNRDWGNEKESLLKIQFSHIWPEQFSDFYATQGISWRPQKKKSRRLAPAWIQKNPSNPHQILCESHLFNQRCTPLPTFLLLITLNYWCGIQIKLPVVQYFQSYIICPRLGPIILLNILLLVTFRNWIFSTISRINTDNRCYNFHHRFTGWLWRSSNHTEQRLRWSRG